MCRFNLSVMSIIVLAASAGASLMPEAAHGQIYVTNVGTNSIGEYDLDGTIVNPSLVSGLDDPWSLAVSGSNIFVTNGGSGTIGEYTTAGGIVSTSLVLGLNSPNAIAVSGSNFYVINGANGVIGEYTTSGVPVNASLVQGFADPWGIAMSGSNLLVTNDNDPNYPNGTVNEYNAGGGRVNVPLVSGLDRPTGIAVSGSELFVANFYSGTIGEYSATDGSVVDASLVTGLPQCGEVDEDARKRYPLACNLWRWRGGKNKHHKTLAAPVLAFVFGGCRKCCRS